MKWLRRRLGMYEVIIQQLVNVIALSIALFFNHLPTLHEMVQINTQYHRFLARKTHKKKNGLF